MEPELALLRHPRLAELATSAWPAWLWRVDGSRILWTNAVGAAIFGAASTAACTRVQFDAGNSSAEEIVRLAATPPTGEPERLENLHGFGADASGALTCACSRLVLDDGESAMLVVATRPAGPTLTLSERLERLIGDVEAPLAAFAPDGALLHANAAALERLAGATTLSALGNEMFAATVLETGSAQGAAQLGGKPLDVAATRLGGEDCRAIMLALQPQKNPPAGNAAAQSEAVPAEHVEHIAPSGAAPVMAASEIPEPIGQAAPASARIEPATAPNSTADAADGKAPVERRHPLRFVWHMDAEGRFGVGSDEFTELVGPRTVAAVDRPWSEVAAELKLDPNNQVAQAVATRETWSGIVISWPIDDSADRLPIELSGLPVFDRERNFRGYRGFGVCRDVERINRLVRSRRERPLGFMPATEGAASEATATLTPPAVVAAATEAASLSGRTVPSAAAAAANVVPFRQSPAAEAKEAKDPKEPKLTPSETKAAPTLSPVERRAFRELAQELTARLREPPATAALVAAATDSAAEHALLDRIPVGILVYRHDALIYANRYFLDWTGYASLAALEAAGGLNHLFAEPASAFAEGGAQTLSLVKENGEKLPADGRLITLPWDGASALALILSNGEAAAAMREKESARRTLEAENHELRSILDAATGGVLTLDADGRVLAANARAAALFGQTPAAMTGRPFAELLTPGSESAARDFFARTAEGGTVLNNALDVEARAGGGCGVPLALTLSRLEGGRFCAVFRDVSAGKELEQDLREAKREALRAAAAKTEFLAKVSHEIRTPLNAMTGFAEVIMAERFGPIGNERYREYLKDIHNAGTHLVSMLNDLLDLSKVETGQIELTFSNVNLNELTQQCVGIMQPQANRARIIIRTALTPGLPLVIADERSLRQIVLNLIGNSIRFTGPGGQVIVSTVFSDAREAVLRVRDTGVGMSEKDIMAALEPFRQTATAGSWGSGGSGFGLPLTKALAEANRAHFSIKSAPNAGTLVEIAFPPNRVVAA